MRKRWVYVDGVAYEGCAPESRVASFQVMPDIKPYRSMIDGREITSRSRHREHLKDHGCVEIGNDSSLYHEPRPLKSPPGLKDAVIRAAYKVGILR